MAFSLNKIMLIGNLGKDCETRFTTGNVSVPYTMLMRYAFINKPISATMDFVSFLSSGKTNTTSFVSLPYTYLYL